MLVEQVMGEISFDLDPFLIYLTLLGWAMFILQTLTALLSINKQANASFLGHNE